MFYQPSPPPPPPSWPGESASVFLERLAAARLLTVRLQQRQIAYATTCLIAGPLLVLAAVVWGVLS